MAGRKREAAKRGIQNKPMGQLGLMDLPDLSDISNMGIDDDDDEGSGGDEGLEDELMALLSGKSQPKAVKRKKPPAPALMDINKMAADCMKDIESDDENDENVSGDEELMSELEAILPESISPVKESAPPPPPPPPRSTSSNSVLATLEDRLNQYKLAESAAKSQGDNLKAKRFGRGIKTLEGLIKSAKAGRDVNEEDIPPQVAIPKNKEPERSHLKKNIITPDDSLLENKLRMRENTENVENFEDSKTMLSGQNEKTQDLIDAEISTPDSVENSDVLLLNQRKSQYKVAALQAKKLGDTQTAIKYVKIAKQFDNVISALESGQPVDLSNMPPPPPVYEGNKPPSIAKSVEPPKNIPQINEKLQNLAMQMAEEPVDPSLFGAPPPPKTIAEALNQRLEKFRSTLEAAKSEGNNGKVRRIGRIVKQYEDAIKRYKAGKPVDFEELATPPGFGPIPIEGAEKEASSVAPTRNVQPSQPVNKPQVPPSRPAPRPPNKPNDKANVVTNTGRNPKLSARSTSFVLDKQLNFLLERQRLFKKAALESKNKGDVQQAKEYLRMSKGIEPMIEATRSGLPIDATSIPTPPQIEEDYVIVEKSDSISVGGGEQNEDLYSRLETDLINQIEICQRNKDHFLKLGDVSSASKFEKLAHGSRKDLDVVKHLHKLGEPLPRFHYETRLFSMVQCNTDLIDTDFEISLERGINLPEEKRKQPSICSVLFCIGKPTELDSYVRIEVPFPTDNPQKAKTHTIRDTNNPEYKETFKFKIDRKSRSLARIFKRQSVKLEVWSKGGFFRSDIILGTLNIKLADLEKKCTIHDSFEIMDGRKSTGGKLEVKLCIRDPLLVKQVEEVRERWLVIGS